MRGGQSRYLDNEEPRCEDVDLEVGVHVADTAIPLGDLATQPAGSVQTSEDVAHRTPAY